jgi:chromosome segregation ATPase
MQQQTEEIQSLVRKSEEETEKVRLEKMAIMQKWTTAVINLSKRDEALETFRIALKNQELALKGVKAEIDGTKEEIILTQEKHDHLTALSQKAERLVGQRKGHIKKTAAEIEEAKLELNKIHEAHLKTLETLKATEAQASNLEKELVNARTSVAKLADMKRDLEEETLDLDRELAVADKSTIYATKQIKNLRVKTRQLEDNLIDTQNMMSEALEDIMAKSTMVDRQEEDIQMLDENIDELSKMLKQIEAGLFKAQHIIDKKQCMIEVHTTQQLHFIEMPCG